MLFKKTNCIDISKLENENQTLFFLGFVIGILIFTFLYTFVRFNADTYLFQMQRLKPDAQKSIRAYLVSIPPEIVQSSPPPIEPEKEEPSAIERETPVEIPPEIVMETVPERENTSTLLQPSDSRKFPNLTGNNIPGHEISEPETLKMPESMALFPERKPEPIITIPIEEVPDKRREFKTDIFGIPLQGIPAKPIHLVRNTPNFIKWTIRDVLKKRRMKKLAEESFAGLSEKDMRFMILVWRDGLLDTGKLSKEDRVFLTESNESDREVMPHNDYLQDMEKRGLVTSLVTGGRLVFRANFARDLMLETLVYERMRSEDQETAEMLDTLIPLFRAYGDSVTTEVPVPDSGR